MSRDISSCILLGRQTLQNSSRQVTDKKKQQTWILPRVVRVQSCYNIQTKIPSLKNKMWGIKGETCKVTKKVLATIPMNLYSGKRAINTNSKGAQILDLTKIQSSYYKSGQRIERIHV